MDQYMITLYLVVDLEEAVDLEETVDVDEVVDVEAVMGHIVPHHQQGHRKQFFSGQANQLQNCVYTEFRVMSGHKCKLLCEAH